LFGLVPSFNGATREKTRESPSGSVTGQVKYLILFTQKYASFG
jgi:hypothetical protein